MARFRERWSGCEITYLWTIGRMAKYLGQPEPKPNPGDFIRDDDEKGNETAKSKIKKIESLSKEQRKKMTREEIMRRHGERFIGKTFGQVTVLGYVHSESNRRVYKCHCARCGRDFLHNSVNLPTIRSCGCGRGGSRKKKE